MPAQQGMVAAFDDLTDSIYYRQVEVDACTLKEAFAQPQDRLLCSTTVQSLEDTCMRFVAAM